MIDDNRVSTFLLSLEDDEVSYLREIEIEAQKMQVPIIKKGTQSLLKVLLQIKNPRNILEIGTAVGFSALLMSEYSPGANITTIENYKKRIPIARENFAKAKKEECISLIEGDALDVLKGLKESYDFIFVDAAKAQYIYYLEELIRLANKDCVIITDNVLQEGDVLESHYAVKRRDRTIHKRMREYLYEIKHNNKLMTSIVPVGDGVAISYVKGECDE
ncbi:MAG: O-methyltransferase [Suipraeoptans sp.]